MKTPAFWFRHRPTLIAYLLWPLSMIYGVLRGLRPTRFVAAAVPLIVIGNITVGGTGKTPVVIALCQLLQQQGKRVHVIAKGYGGCIKTATLVNLATHTAHDVGDEALLLAQHAPTWIGADRGACLIAAQTGADIIISDDGLQSNRLKPTLCFAVIDGMRGLGNGMLLPAGPLRESYQSALPRIDAFIQMGGDDVLLSDRPTLMADFVVAPQNNLSGKTVIAVAGIGDPQKFFTTVRQLGMQPAQELAYADHYAYQPADFERLQQLADRHHCTLVTTEKDAVKWPAALLKHTHIIRGQAQFREPNLLNSFLQKVLR